MPLGEGRRVSGDIGECSMAKASLVVNGIAQGSKQQAALGVSVSNGDQML